MAIALAACLDGRILRRSSSHRGERRCEQRGDGARRRGTRDPQAQRRGKGRRGPAVFRPVIGDAKRPGQIGSRPVRGGYIYNIAVLRLGPRRSALCGVVDLPSPRDVVGGQW
jgi:hypothetical protein